MLDSRSLQLAIENGIIDEDEIRLQVEMYERKKYLAMHTQAVWQDKKGYWLTYLPDSSKSNGRRLVKKKDKKILDDLIVKHYSEEDDQNRLRFEDVFEKWAQEKLHYGYIKRQTYDRYHSDYTRFFANANTVITKIPFCHITEMMLDEFIKTSIMEQKLTSKGWAKIRTILLGTFTRGKKEGLTDIQIRDFIYDMDIPRRAFRKQIFPSETQVFRKDEVMLIINYLNEANTKEKYPARKLVNLGILLDFETGVRAGELSALKWGDVNLQLKTLHLQRTEVFYTDSAGIMKRSYDEGTKGRDGSRTVLLTNRAIDILKQIRRINPFRDFIFWNEVSNTSIHGTSFTRKLKRICEYLGITQRSLHKARKTYATNLLNSGVADPLIISQMGHVDISTTKTHYWYNDSTREDSIAKLEAASGWGD